MTSEATSSFGSLLVGLGKATRRGVRKCPACGTVNGTRAVSCKNRKCDVIFKLKEAATSGAANTPSKRAASTAVKPCSTSWPLSLYDCVPLITDSGPFRRLYSVKAGPVVRNGPHDEEQRCFVLLCGQPNEPTTHVTPTLASLDATESNVAEDAGWPSVSRCFFDQCPGVAAPTLTRYCPHVAACRALEADETQRAARLARPLRLKQSVLNTMEISGDLKHEIWLSARRGGGPLVQRVSKEVVVAKCAPGGQRHPLGYLHVTFKAKESVMSCSCEDADQGPCLHFYACAAVFASDPALADEFAFFVGLQQHRLPPAADDIGGHLITILGQDENGEPVAVEVFDGEEHLGGILMGEATGADGSDLRGSDSNAGGGGEQEVRLRLSTPEGGVQTVMLAADEEMTTAGPTSGRKRGSELAALRLAEESLRPSPVEPTSAELTFTGWLASVTETVNQLMHFGHPADGRPEPPVFSAPSSFFKCLRERLSGHSGQKERLPDATAMVRRDRPPFGLFAVDTYRIFNIFRLKQVMDTPKVKLEVTRAFAETSPGHFDSVTQPQPEVTSNSLLKPQEWKTFLKVGRMTPPGKTVSGARAAAAAGEPHPFTLEWTSDLQPASGFGELRVIFTFGHSRNGRELETDALAAMTTSAKRMKRL